MQFPDEARCASSCFVAQLLQHKADIMFAPHLLCLVLLFRMPLLAALFCRGAGLRRGGVRRLLLLPLLHLCRRRRLLLLRPWALGGLADETAATRCSM